MILKFFKATDGLLVAPADALGTTTLVAGTYYADMPSALEALGYLQLAWASLDATITVESTGFPDATLTQAAGTHWMDEEGIDDIVPAGDGGARVRIVDNAAPRLRLTIVVTGDGGTLRGAWHRKGRG